jgi:hypothetical protein
MLKTGLEFDDENIRFPGLSGENKKTSGLISLYRPISVKLYN